MVPNLLKLSEEQVPLHQLYLVDPSARPAPVQQNKGALYFAWLWDFGLAFLISNSLIFAWLELLGQLVYPFVSPDAQRAFEGSADSMTIILTALTHACLTFSALNASGQTFGMRIFKHRVTSGAETLSWQQSLLWACGSTVSLASAGLTSLLLDRLSLTSTVTEEHFHWSFVTAPVTLQSAPDLVAGLTTEVAALESYETAA